MEKTMKDNAILWLRISYWAGAMLDAIAGLTMVSPALFALLNRPVNFHPANDFRYAMGMGAPLMFAWSVLLLWANRKPLERMGILPITLLVICGEVATQIWGLAGGFVPFQALAPTFLMQIVLVALFSFSYLNARKTL
jgi:hypothetical protein